MSRSKGHCALWKTPSENTACRPANQWQCEGYTPLYAQVVSVHGIMIKCLVIILIKESLNRLLMQEQ